MPSVEPGEYLQCIYCCCTLRPFEYYYGSYSRPICSSCYK